MVSGTRAARARAPAATRGGCRSTSAAARQRCPWPGSTGTTAASTPVGLTFPTPPARILMWFSMFMVSFCVLPLKRNHGTLSRYPLVNSDVVINVYGEF